MTKIINLENINQEDSNFLLYFFEAQSGFGEQFWAKNTIYSFDGKEFSLENDIVQRQRKEGNMGFRYEVLSNEPPIGKGRFGEVVEIKGTLSLDENTYRFKKAEKNARVVKIQYHSWQKNLLENLENEYYFANKAGHLGIKKPTVIKIPDETSTSFTVMKKSPGQALSEIIHKERNERIKILTTQQRLELTNALLVALNKQVTSKNIIHRDLKPKNIFVDLNSPISVKILDYGSATDSNNPDDNQKITRCFFAPEIFLKWKKLSPKADVFSMARVIALIWGVNLDTYNPELDPNEYRQYDASILLKGLFTGISDLSSTAKESIRLMLIVMLQSDPELRCTIEQAINSCPAISYEPKQKSTCAFFNFFEDSADRFFEKIENSWLTEEQQFAVQKTMWELEKELQSCWPCNRTRKEEKIKGLKLLLQYSKESMDIDEAIRTIEGFYPEFRAGQFSTRIATLMKELGASENDSDLKINRKVVNS